ncbi:MAG TPA: gluconate 2-dehydrogenase subunit 3 family protein [Acidimicrobiales bacterium]|nr:gluconate 2-dehydrogenase subunit 3 family protein [Acidimicrobiales bacterium]
MPLRPPSRHAVTPGDHGRFPEFDVLDEVHRWDDVTAGVVLARLGSYADFSFFSPSEQATADALLDQLLAQRDEPKVPVLPMLDRRLALGETDGWRFEDMPDDPEAWRVTLAALEEDAHTRLGRSFHQLGWEQQGRLVQAVNESSTWHGMEGSHVWSLWTRYACAAFYSHPWAWNEIGFSGPAYPRGYKALGVDQREAWETSDHEGTDPVVWEERRSQALEIHTRTSGGKSSSSHE